MRIIVVLLCLLVLAPAAPLAAQGDNPPDSGPLFNSRDLWFAGGFVAGTIAMFPLDRALAQELQDSTLQANRALGWSADLVGDFGRTGAFVIGPALWAVGRLTGSDRVADLGLHGAEAIIVAEVVNRSIKALAGRARPYVTDSRRPGDFNLLRGLQHHDYQSFVSGHSAVAFAAAAAVVQETEEWWPAWKPYIGTAMFGGATLVALSRMYQNKHWASDVLAGAAIGSFAGWKVIRWNHTSDPDNFMNRWLLGVSLVPTSAGRMPMLWIAPALW